MFLIGSMGVVLAANALGVNDGQKPNILFIVAEDASPTINNIFGF